MLLERIASAADVRSLPEEKLAPLAEEIRQRIIEVVSSIGGHLASSLGAVELAIALHYCLNTPKDKIVWDVGHQAYAHKILTGRNAQFICLRQYKGLSGFPSRDESEYDPFTAGHSSSAVSLALGMVAACDFLPEKERSKVVAVIGDGSISGGLCFEGLNNAGHLKRNLVVVLNTNELSIAPNVGALSTYLNKLISLPVYNRFKSSLEAFVQSRVPRGSRLLTIANKFEEGLKGLFVPGVFFEELGFRYFGPFDGHDLGLLIRNFRKIFSIAGPVLIHVITKKGKGYAPAERDPVRFHSAAPFEIKTGSAVAAKAASPSYTSVLSDCLLRVGKENRTVCAITAAMSEGTGLDKFRDLYPERFFDVGIAEGHAVCFAAGLARQGMKPVVAIYSTFLQRAYDQIVEDVALQGLGVVFAIDRAGIVGGDGATHQGIFDIAYLRSVPNLVIAAPKNGAELARMLEAAVASDRPFAIRYPKDAVPLRSMSDSAIETGKAELLLSGKDASLIALGAMVEPSLRAAELLEKEGLRVGVVNARFVKPLDTELLRRVTKESKRLFTVEEGVVSGGFGSAVNEALGVAVVRIGLPSAFLSCGSRAELLAENGLSAEGIAGQVKAAISKG